MEKKNYSFYSYINILEHMQIFLFKSLSQLWYLIKKKRNHFIPIITYNIFRNSWKILVYKKSVWLRCEDIYRAILCQVSYNHSWIYLYYLNKILICYKRYNFLLFQMKLENKYNFMKIKFFIYITIVSILFY